MAKLGSQRVALLGGSATLTATQQMRKYCLANTDEFTCQVNYNHDPSQMNPIGGGPGYDSIVTQGDHEVSTKAELITALDAAVSGETIYVDPSAEIDLTGEQLFIKGGVRLASNRGFGDSQGALLYSTSVYTHDGAANRQEDISSVTDPGGGDIRFNFTRTADTDVGDTVHIIGTGLYDTTNATGPLTVTAQAGFYIQVPGTYSATVSEGAIYEVGDCVLLVVGEGVRITGIRFRGPNSEREKDEDPQVFNFIRVGHPYTEIDNCAMYSCDKWAIDIYDNRYCYIHHNTWYNTIMESFGYHIWTRGTIDLADPTDAEVTKIYGNLCWNGRHEIASSGAASGSYKAYYNFVVDHVSGNHQFDRHTAGELTDVRYCVSTSRTGNNKFLGGWNVAPGNAINMIECYTAHTSDSDAIDNTKPGYTQTGNHYSSDWMSDNRPEVTISVDTSSGAAPLSVTYTATGTDPTGNFPINAYIWELDGDREIITTASNTLSKTYSTEAVKIVGVRARNVAGIPSSLRCAMVDVRASSVKPLEEWLVDWWEFAETSGDRVGSHNGYVLSVSAGTPTRVAGHIASSWAVDFDGSASLSINKKPGTNIEPFAIYDQDFTIACWIRRDASDTQTNAGVIGHLPIQRGISVLHTNGGINFQHQGQNYSAGSLTSATWVHVVLRYDRDGTRETWVNGSRVGTPPTNTYTQFKESLNSHNEQLSIAPLLSLVRMIGSVAEFAVWRTWITDDQIADLYNGGTGIDYANIPAS